MNEHLLKLENLTYNSPEGDSLFNVSFMLEKGENIVFFGPEKSGLDLICTLIIGFETGYEGDIFYKGRSIKEFDYRESMNYRKDMGFLHPDHGLIANMSVEQNISLPLEYHSKLNSDEVKKYVNSLIDELNLDHCKKFRPVDLANSEILRTSYGRAIALDPDILILEHAFENQSPLNIQSFIKNLKKRIDSRDKSVIFVTYEPEKFVEYAEKFVMFFNGGIVFQGSSYDFLNSDNSYLKQYTEMRNYGPMTIL
jgi:ABC-type transporter Mla maintaining outer membrane lipid asymmetry ATPase subunit MlaF